MKKMHKKLNPKVINSLNIILNFANENNIEFSIKKNQVTMKNKNSFENITKLISKKKKNKKRRDTDVNIEIDNISMIKGITENQSNDTMQVDDVRILGT